MFHLYARRYSGAVIQTALLESYKDPHAAVDQMAREMKAHAGKKIFYSVNDHHLVGGDHVAYGQMLQDAEPRGRKAS